MEKPEQAAARKLYQDSGGRMLLKDIAAQLGVPEGTLRSWKNRYGWDKQSATLQTGATQRKRRAATNRKAAEKITANEELDEREKDFCAAFVHAPNASQAAVMTGRYGSYGAARVAACKMMQKPAVQEEIKRLRTMKRMMLLAEADDVVEMHMRIAFADMSAFVEWGQETVPVMTAFGPLELPDPETGEKKAVTQQINTIHFKEQSEVDGALIQQVKVGRDGASVKLVDRQKSLDFLERFFLLNPMDQHKQEYDNKRLGLTERGVKIQEDKMHGITTDIETIREGLKSLMDVINAPVPDRGLPDE